MIRNLIHTINMFMWRNAHIVTITLVAICIMAFVWMSPHWIELEINHRLPTKAATIRN